MSKTLIAGNWKMHLTAEQSRGLAERVEKTAVKYSKAVDVVVCPTHVCLPAVAAVTKKLSVGAQNIYFADEGAFTGEVSANQVKEFVRYVIVGHSERRHVFGELNEMVARKAAACLRHNLTPIICVGEIGYERDHGETVQVLNDQIATGLTMLTAAEIEQIVIAYEPVWAIGTGENAKPEDVAAAARTINQAIQEMFGAAAASKCRILYGGSVTAATAASYLALEEISGLLVGGASLNEHEFNDIVEQASHDK
ncbi:MAG: triose-phosphate isomerase [Candidatus Saccharimonadales bacterium]